MSVFNDMLDHMGGVMPALPMKMTQCKEDLYFAVKFVHQKQFWCYSDVNPMTGTILITVHIFDHFWKLHLCKKWDKQLETNPENETSYSTQHLKVFGKYMENGYCAKYEHFPVIESKCVPGNIHFSCVIGSRCGQSSYDPYDLSSNDKNN